MYKRQVYEVLKSEYQRQQEEGFCVAEVDGMTNFIFTNRFGNPPVSYTHLGRWKGNIPFL